MNQNFRNLIINALHADLNLIDYELKTGPWKLTDLALIPKNGFKVLSTFSCGGGSTMGYKLAGYEVIGCVEIDPQMIEIYKANHHPKYAFNMPVQQFKTIPDSDLPPELFELDILDGSPPCSVFSTAGSREKKWGKAHQFREGQAKQRLDDLFFHFIDVAAKLRPKVVVAENVKGLIQGNARGYVKQIFQAFREAGYNCQLFLLNSAKMGVPQARERTFFVANRLGKSINLSFNEEVITARDIVLSKGTKSCNVPEKALNLWHLCQPGKSFSSVHPLGHSFNSIKQHPDSPLPTIAASYGQGSWAGIFHWNEPRQLYIEEYTRGQSFPDDYNYANTKPVYVCGMSVPPFMMQRIANQIYRQLLFNPGDQTNA